ncbi:MAG: CAP domain-containing protein [Acidobacteria bacterium]|nr:CAP domain-containing protein [Acidobacteriota bacterium]
MRKLLHSGILPLVATGLLTLFQGFDGVHADEGDGAVEAEILELANAERRQAGLTPLIREQGLSALARQHSESMAAGGFFAHIDREGLDADGRRRTYDPGLFTVAYAENIVAVSWEDPHRTALDCVRCWMASGGHRRNLLDPKFTHTGVGVARGTDGRLRATQVFARPLARLVGCFPARPRPGHTLRLDFTYLGPPSDRDRIRVAVIFPDPRVRFPLPKGMYSLGVGYFSPRWAGDRFTVAVPCRYGTGNYQVALGFPERRYPAFYTIPVK